MLCFFPGGADGLFEHGLLFGNLVCPLHLVLANKFDICGSFEAYTQYRVDNYNIV